MNKDEIEYMWKVARNDPHHDFNWFDPVVVKFAQLVAEHEREACAKMCDYVYDNIVTDEHIKDMAFKIRARGQE